MGSERATKLRRMKVLVRGADGTIVRTVVRARDRDEVLCGSCDTEPRVNLAPAGIAGGRVNVVANGQIITPG